MFASKVADTVAAAATALSSGSGETLTTAGGWAAGLDEPPSPAPPQAATPAANRTIAIRPQRARFTGHLLDHIKISAWFPEPAGGAFAIAMLGASCRIGQNRKNIQAKGT
jgi:hypothetical protein